MNYNYINLSKLNKEIKEARVTRNIIIDNFIKDSNYTIHNLNIDYLNKVPFPLIITNRDLFSDNNIKVKIYKDYMYHDYLFNNEGLVNDKEDLITNSIMLYIKGLFRVKEEESILDNEFYQDLIINLYNRYTDKIIINRYGINIDKDLLRKIKIINSQELDKYRLNNNKKKVLKMYRG